MVPSEHTILLRRFYNGIARAEAADRERPCWDTRRIGNHRLIWLRKAARWQLDSWQRYIDRRRGSWRLPKATGTCFCCQARPATQRHHVIQIKNGGRNIAQNIVHVCKRCHQLIHPWMRKQRPAPKPVFDPTPRLVKRPAVALSPMA